ncbi:Dynamin family protein [Lentzea fradiae]|uniref:Dynamin family protein n=1 Tax=Lentzea fradiae TaxID=200378 RepID=A0A1G7KYK2_9PSEU|nr:dynamin family protein [Lentzea fradiae]SDF42283.1 Dynamin family protein [Lentzea fradiae]
MSTRTPIEVVDLALKAVDAYRREDLAARLALTRHRLLDPAVRVLVVGEFKQGKSQLVNAIVNAPVCPVDDDVATAVPVAVRYADEPGATLVGEDGSRTGVAVDRLEDHVSEAGNPGNRRGLREAEVGLPRSVLAGGLCLVDTPGVGGLGSVHGAVTMAALPAADAVVVVSDAAQEYTATELEFLRQAARVCPTVVCVLTKIDLYPDWRRVADRDRAHLATADVPAELFPVSSTLRLHAVRTTDQALNQESGFPELLTHLRERIVGRAADLARRSVAHDVRAVVLQLTTSMEAELTALRDPEGATDLVGGLQVAKQRADALRERSARWQQTLGDGIADLISDVEFDLRDRMRQITREAEAELDGIDPALVEEQFAGWVRQRVSAAASATFVWTHQRARWLAGQVGEHFADEGGEVLPDLHSRDPDSTLGRAVPLAFDAPESFGFGKKLLVGVRGGYGGTLMVGMLSTVGGLALLNPLSLAAGVLLGGKVVKDERKRMLEKRRADAKAAVRRSLDDVVFQLGKDSRDLLRELQRDLRDHFTTRAGELSRSLGESIRSAQSAAEAGREERDKRLLDVRAELKRVAHLAAAADALAEPVGSAS